MISARRSARALYEGLGVRLATASAVLLLVTETARRVLKMQASSSADAALTPRRPTPRSGRLALGFTLATAFMLLAVIGASAQHGAGAAELRRGPASVVLSVLITLAALAGLGSLALLFWGLVTRNRKNFGDSARRGRSPVLLVGAVLAIFACLSGLVVLALRERHQQVIPALHGQPDLHGGATTSPLPFNQAASFTTSGLVICLVLLLVFLRLARSLGWRRALRRLGPLGRQPESDFEPDSAPATEVEAFGLRLAGVSVPDPAAEPDPRRAVIACYLQLLEVAARHGPERRESETPTEYLRRVLADTDAAASPASTLTGLFERARYSDLPVDESMRADAISALRALQNAYLAGAVV